MSFSPPSSDKLSDWLVWLEQLHLKNIDLGLERINAVAERLNLKSFACPVITVGGTNGKGSTVAVLEAIYLEAGYRVGAYTSPHLLQFNERIRLMGQDIDDASLLKAFQAIEKQRGDITLTFFEYTTLAALWLFQQAALDVLILEVGLGGRLDAVNIIDADVAVVTSIALDHTDWLGHTRELIAIEKAGIFRSHKPAICGDFSPPDTLIEVANKLDAGLLLQGKDFNFQVQADSWDWQGGELKLNNLPLPELALQNVSTALMAYASLAQRLPVSQTQLAQALKTARVTGRFQQIAQRPTVILDVAHNPAGAALLAERLQQLGQKRVIAVFSALKDKDISAMVAALSEIIAAWYIAPLVVARACSSADLKELTQVAGGCNIHDFKDIKTAYQQALLHSRPDDCIIVFGSFYTVAEILGDKKQTE